MLNQQIIRKLLTVILLGTGFMVSHCEKKEDDNEEKKETIGTKSAGTGSGGGGSSGTYLESAASAMVPRSLSSSAGLRLDADNPCEGTAGFFDCQPNLIKLYVGIAKSMVEMTAEISGGVSDVINQLEIGSSGTLSDVDEEIPAIDYIVESAEKYTLLVYSSSGPFLYLDVDESEAEKSYSLLFNAAGFSESDGGPENVAIDLSYTDDDNLTIAATFYGMECSSDDIRAPERGRVHIAKVDGVFQGKAMLYMPRWLYADGDGTTCNTPVVASDSMYMYTDFAGVDAKVTASLYMLNGSAPFPSAASSWEASDFCSNFSDLCSNGMSFGESVALTTYANPFCITPSSTSWGSACSGYSADDYSSDSLWFNQDDLKDFDAALPTSL